MNPVWKILYTLTALLILILGNQPSVQNLVHILWDGMAILFSSLLTPWNVGLLLLALAPWILVGLRRIPLEDLIAFVQSIPPLTRAKVFVSGTGLMMLLLDLVKNGFSPDTGALLFFGLTVLPWLTSLITSARLPGGLEVTFKDIAQAPQIVADGAFPRSRHDRSIFENWNSIDPRLALVALRIEIEKRIRALASLAGHPHSHPLTALIRELAESRELPRQIAPGLLQLVSVGNAAAHGAEVSMSVNEWAHTYGAQVIQRLDAEVRRRERK